MKIVGLSQPVKINSPTGMLFEWRGELENGEYFVIRWNNQMVGFGKSERQCLAADSMVVLKQEGGYVKFLEPDIAKITGFLDMEMPVSWIDLS